VKAFDAGCAAVDYHPSEWHHVSMYANCVWFFDVSHLTKGGLSTQFWIAALEASSPAKRKSITATLGKSLEELKASVEYDLPIVGYGGVMPQNAWFPVTCELQNTVPTFTGVIEISNDQLSKGQSRQMKIELPANTLKRVTIPVFASARYITWNIRLLDTRGKLLAEPNYIGSKAVAGTPLLGVLPRNASGVPTLPQIKSRNPELQPVAVRLQPEFFPDNPLVLDGLPMIYISSERIMGMTVPQVNALLQNPHAYAAGLVGLVMLVGIAVSNSILMVEFTRRLRAEARS